MCRLSGPNTVKRMQTAANKVEWLLGVLKAGAVAAGLGLLAVRLWGVCIDGLGVWESGSPLRPDEALLPLVAFAALLGVLWFGCCLLVELLARLPGTVGRCAARVAAVVTPRVVRRVATALLGLGMTTGLGPGAAVAATPAASLAAPPPAPAPSPGAATPVDPGLPPLPDPGFGSAPNPGWVPTAPTVRSQPDVRVLTPSPRDASPAPEEELEVVVHRGDSLWSIAARHLGPGVSDGEVADAWPAWYAANREVIGPDPDLLLPGQVLRAPEVVGS